MRRALSVIGVGVLVTVALATPANAGTSGWTSTSYYKNHSTGLTHGHRYYDPGQEEAYTARYGWAGLGVQTRYNAYGQWYYTDDEVQSHYVSIVTPRIDQHESWW